MRAATCTRSARDEVRPAFGWALYRYLCSRGLALTALGDTSSGFEVLRAGDGGGAVRRASTGRWSLCSPVSAVSTGASGDPLAVLVLVLVPLPMVLDGSGA